MPSNNKNQSPSSKKQTRVVKNENIYSKKKIEKTKSSKYIITIILLIISLLFNSYAIYHFVTFNHNKVKIVTKTKIKKTVPENILFLGDSITELYDIKKYYPNRKVVNSGISGDTTDDILNNIEKRVYQYNPSKVILLIGTNDLDEGKNVEEVYNNIRTIIEEINENRNNAKIYIESLYPVNHEIKSNRVINQENIDIREVNEKLKELSKEKEITYIDLYHELEDSNENLEEKYTKDGLHLNEAGYEIVTKKIENYL